LFCWQRYWSRWRRGDPPFTAAAYGVLRYLFFFGGAIALTGYGTFLNFAPIEFAEVTGLYIATLFVVFQITNYVVFRAVPTGPVLVGGMLIVTGGLVVGYWR
jgi:hypothetical protein